MASAIAITLAANAVCLVITARLHDTTESAPCLPCSRGLVVTIGDRLGQPV